MLTVFDVFALAHIPYNLHEIHEIGERRTVTYEAPEYDD